MIFFKRKSQDKSTNQPDKQDSVVESGLRTRLRKTRQAISALFIHEVVLDDNLLDDLEDHLIMADMGAEAATQLMDKVRHGVKQNKISDTDDLFSYINELLVAMLLEAKAPMNDQHKPFVIMLVGVNGAGKTTTAARLAHYYQSQGKSVMMAACDTFRAAAIEQLQSWGQRLNVPVIAQTHGADAAAVAHDAYESAKARNMDVLLIDTAGRQHTHSSLMDQLAKLNRVLQKLDPALPHETMIVLDAGNGQNAISQVENFNKITPLSCLTVTKLDGTAKGGVLIALVKKFGLPVQFIGVGEAMQDLRVFDPVTFVAALLPESFSDKNCEDNQGV